jgi:alkylation response protein AidB-like acyl-CoA dehydrogenase
MNEGSACALADPDGYLALHAMLDESVADALLDVREKQVRRDVRSVVASEVAPRAAELDRTKTFAHDSYQALARAGLAGLLFPTDVGGSDDSTVAYAAAMEEIAAGCPATSLVYMTQTHTAYPILLAGTADLAHRYIPGLLSGGAYGSLAITEPGAGSDVSSLATTATVDRVTGGYRINGSKTLITTGDKASVIICFATTDRSAGRAGITAFVVDGDAEGVTRGAPFVKMGMHGSTTSEVFFDGVAVPAANRLGEEGSGWQVVMRSVIKSRISAAAQGIGIARGAYAHALAALTRRHGTTFPRQIASELADLRGRVLQGRLLLFATAREVDAAREPPAGHIAIMKQSCTDLGFRVALDAVRLLGDAGDQRALGVERYLRDAKVTQIYDGTNEVQRLIIARDTTRRLNAIRA